MNDHKIGYQNPQTIFNITVVAKAELAQSYMAQPHTAFLGDFMTIVLLHGPGHK